MEQAQSTNSTEQRRRLLKGALGASTVMTLGYGGAAAAASISCVAKVRELSIGGPPLNTLQFTMTQPSSPTTAHVDWGWKKVQVLSYKYSTGPAFDAFEVNNNIYKTSAPSVAIPFGASPDKNQPKGYPKDAWVLAYFDDGGSPVGTYPTYQLAAPGATPAAQSCLTSINAGIVGGFTFGG